MCTSKNPVPTTHLYNPPSQVLYTKGFEPELPSAFQKIFCESVAAHKRARARLTPPFSYKIRPRPGAVHEGARARLRGGEHHDGDADPPLGAGGGHPPVPHGPGGDRHLLRDSLQPHEGPGRPCPRTHDLARELSYVVDLVMSIRSSRLCRHTYKLPGVGCCIVV